MNRRWIGYAVWLLLTACLYFFENNTGTRAVLLCSLLLPFVPPLRPAFFSPDESGREEKQETLTVSVFHLRESEEPGDIRQYVPGDPVQRIHWKLSAKKNELLLRDTVAQPETTEETFVSIKRKRERRTGRLSAVMFAAGCTGSLLLFLLIPEVNRGMQALCNRLFTASEAVNSYVYFYFDVPEDQNVFPAAVVLIGVCILLPAMAIALQSRLMALGIMACCTLFQVYFGLAFPAWLNIFLYGLLGLWMMKRPFRSGSIVVYCVFLALIVWMVLLFLPGVNAATEAASERVRDQLTRLTENIAGIIPETPEGEKETRHMHARSLESGNGEAETEQKFRLVTVEEEQISMPLWVNWMKMILLLLLTVALVTLPFMPFLILNARSKKAKAIRKTFESDNVSEAIRAIFQQIILLIETVDYGAGNLPYREWACLLPENLPEGYPDRFARCAADYEEAVYSDHKMPEQKRQNALELLEETKIALWGTANRRQRLHLKYRMCLSE